MGYVAYGSNTTTNNNRETNQIGFFSLKNDGDEAIVRIMHDDTSSFEIISTHQVQINGKFRRVSCVRSPKDPIDSCPLCLSGVKTDYKFYIHLIQYTMNSDGSVVAEPKVWERTLTYADKISGYINNYGPMSDVICKIIRHGKAGDMKTEYDIIPNLSKSIYKDDVFVKNVHAFDGFKALGGIVLNKTSEEINEFIRTGNFPIKHKEVSADSTQNADFQGFNNDLTPDTIEWSVEQPKTQSESTQRQYTAFGNDTTKTNNTVEEFARTANRPSFVTGFAGNDNTIQRPKRF